MRRLWRQGNGFFDFAAFSGFAQNDTYVLGIATS
jgi:hypothetical protein